VREVHGAMEAAASTSIQGAHQGKYHDLNHNKPEGLFRYLTKGPGKHILYTKPDVEVAYTLSGTYHESELRDDGEWVGNATVKPGELWEVPVYKDGTALFAGNKSAQKDQDHDNYRIVPVQDGEDVTLEFYLIVRINSGKVDNTRKETVNTWKRVGRSHGVEDLASATAPL